MKTMNCKLLGGVCEEKFSAETFEEMAELSKKHGTEMAQKGDRAHLDAMDEMKDKMNNPEVMHRWLEGRKKEFDTLPEDK